MLILQIRQVTYSPAETCNLRAVYEGRYCGGGDACLLGPGCQLLHACITHGTCIKVDEKASPPTIHTKSSANLQGLIELDSIRTADEMSSGPLSVKISIMDVFNFMTSAKMHSECNTFERCTWQLWAHHQRFLRSCCIICRLHGAPNGMLGPAFSPDASLVGSGVHLDSPLEGHSLWDLA